MGKGKLTAEKRDHLRGLKKAARIRKRLADGKATPKEKRELEAELAALPQPKQTGRPRKNDPEVDTEAADAQIDPAIAQEAGDAAESSVPPPPPPSVDAPPPPPRVSIEAKSKGDWRAKYRQHTGREAACVEVAELYCSGLERVGAWIADQGVPPVFTKEQIRSIVYPAAVLTTDRLLPPDVEMTPELTVITTSAALTAQAVVVAARKKREAKNRGPARVIPFEQPQPAPPKADAPPPGEGGPPSQEEPPRQATPIKITDPDVIF